jgi:hypothetical protein
VELELAPSSEPLGGRLDAQDGARPIGGVERRWVEDAPEAAGARHRRALPPAPREVGYAGRAMTQPEFGPPQGQPAVPVWGPPPAAPPGAPPGASKRPFDRRVDTFGIVVLITGGCGVLWSLFKIASAVLAGPLTQIYLAWLGNISPRAPVANMMGPASDFLARISAFETANGIVMLVCSAILAWFGLGVRRRAAGSFERVRKWSIAALVVLALSTIARVIITIPATLAYTAQIAARMPKTPGSPVDVGAITSSVTMVSTVMSVGLGVVMLAIAPIVLLVWSARLKAEADQGASAGAGRGFDGAARGALF